MQESQSSQSDGTGTGGNKIRKAGAILEVLGIYMAGQLLAFVIASVLGIPLANPLTALTADTPPAELLTMTGKLLVILALQYVGWFVLIAAIGWWHRKRTPARYGLTLAAKPLVYHAAVGVVLFALAALPLKLVDLANSIVPLGESIPWREALYQLDWGRWEFWLFMAVGSFGLVPILEELFYRGYCQTRLEEDFGAPTAILSVAVLFTLSHSQYFVINALNLSTLVALLVIALASGYIFYATRSLAAPVLAHALLNFPVRGIALWVMLALMVVVCVVARKGILQFLKDFRSTFSAKTAWGQAAVVVAIFGLFALASTLLADIALLLGLLFFVIALVLDGIDRKRTKASQAV